MLNVAIGSDNVKMVPQQEAAAVGSCRRLDESVTLTDQSQAAIPRYNMRKLKYLTKQHSAQAAKLYLRAMGCHLLCDHTVLSSTQHK